MRLIEHFFGLIAPSSCLNCGTEGSVICLWCREETLPDQISRCYKCNRLTKDGAVCPACRRTSALKHIFIRTGYEGTARELIHKMKFSYSGEAADLVSSELVSTIPALPPETILVHIPTITNHVRLRGFDHARRIAVGLSSASNLKHVPALARLGQHRQVGSKRHERLHAMDDVFRVQQVYLVKDMPVLLVDDVLTTGATLEAAARALKRAGARSVSAAVFARAK